MTVEITTRDTSEANTAKLMEDFERHVGEHHVFREPPTHLGKAITDHASPVFRNGEAENLQGERAKLAAEGIDCVGRQGNFEYLNSSAAAARATTLAEEIIRSIP